MTVGSHGRRGFFSLTESTNAVSLRMDAAQEASIIATISLPVSFKPRFVILLDGSEQIFGDGSLIKSLL